MLGAELWSDGPAFRGLQRIARSNFAAEDAGSWLTGGPFTVGTLPAWSTRSPGNASTLGLDGVSGLRFVSTAGVDNGATRTAPGIECDLSSLIDSFGLWRDGWCLWVVATVAAGGPSAAGHAVQLGYGTDRLSPTAQFCTLWHDDGAERVGGVYNATASRSSFAGNAMTPGYIGALIGGQAPGVACFGAAGAAPSEPPNADRIGCASTGTTAAGAGWSSADRNLKLLLTAGENGAGANLDVTIGAVDVWAAVA